MANICDNRFFFCCENNSCKYINLFNELKDKLSYFMFDVIDYDDKFCTIEGEFESKWTFPADIFEDLDFKEEHTGLEDVLIETAIMAYCYRQHKKFETRVYTACWRIVQNKRKEIAEALA